jgi:DNA-binding transcriptional LysR family regulator
MNLDRLKLFVEIVERGSISEASRRVNLTQPAVSRNLKCLEEELGAALFERVGHRLMLTAAGRALLPQAKGLLTQVEQAEREVRRRAERRYFDVRLGAIHSVMTYALPEVLITLREAFPELEIKLTGGRTQGLLALLNEDGLDLALVAGAGAPPRARPRA